MYNIYVQEQSRFYFSFTLPTIVLKNLVTALIYSTGLFYNSLVLGQKPIAKITKKRNNIATILK